MVKANSAAASFEESPAVKLVIAEYQSIKAEQKARIGFRDNLLYVTLASMMTAAAISLGYESTSALLILPPAAIVLGWTYLMNDEKISAISRYVRTELAKSLRGEIPTATSTFKWESDHRSDRRYRIRKHLQLAIDLSVFCMVPLFALLMFWLGGDIYSPLLVAISALEALGVMILAIQIVGYADLGAGV